MARETEHKELDAEVLARGVAAVFDDPRRGFYLVAEIDESVVACLMITFEWSDWRDNLFWWVQSVYVDPAHRGRGVYRTLYRAAKRMAAETGGVCGFRLYVERDNARAQKTYQSLGMNATNYLMYEELLAEE